MKRLFTAIVAVVTLLSFATPGFAQSSEQQNSMSGPSATKTPKAMKSPSAMMHSSMSSSSMKSSHMKSCPKGSSMVSGYTKANGTVVKPYCRKG